MKTAFCLLFVGVLLSSGAFAASVGDIANYAGTFTTASGEVYPMTFTLNVKSIAPSGNYSIENTMTVLGHVQTKTTEMTPQQLGTDAETALLVTNCATANGIAEQVTIGSGETLATCKITSSENGGTMIANIAAVPFRSAKWTQVVNGNTIAMMLQSYVRGQ